MGVKQHLHLILQAPQQALSVSLCGDAAGLQPVVYALAVDAVQRHAGQAFEHRCVGQPAAGQQMLKVDPVLQQERLHSLAQCLGFFVGDGVGDTQIHLPLADVPMHRINESPTVVCGAMQTLRLGGQGGQWHQAIIDLPAKGLRPSHFMAGTHRTVGQGGGCHTLGLPPKV